MKKSNLFIVTIFFCFISFAQFNSEFLKYSDYGKNISTYGDYELGSNCLNGKFINKLYFGGFIENSLKESVSKKLNKNNIVGGGVSFGLNYFFGKDSSKFDWLVGLKNQEVINGAFSRDFFNTLFFGNSMYKGQIANFENTSLNYLRFQEIKVGFIWKNIDSLGKIGFALSFLKGQSMIRYKQIDTNFLYTSSDASELNYKASFLLELSDTLNSGWSVFNGTGLSADLYFDAPYKSKLGPSRIIVSVNNLGFIRWNQNSLTYSVDSLFKFQGVNINNFLVLNDSALNVASQDTIINNLTRITRNKINVNLPMNLLLIHQVDFTKNYGLRMGLRNIFNGNSKPLFFLENRFNFKDKFLTGLMFSYGGYNRFSFGGFFEYSGNNFNLRIGSIALQGFVTSQNWVGQSLFLTLSKKI